MDFGAAFRFPLGGPHWTRKLIIPGIIGLIPFVGQIYLLGFSLSIAKRAIITQDPEPMPDLDFGSDIKRGIMLLVIGLGYGLPIILVLFIMSMVLVVTGVMFASTSPSGTSTAVLLVMQSGFAIIALLYGLVITFFVPVAIGHYLARGEQIGAAFHFSEIWSILKVSPTNDLLMILGLILSFILGTLGGVFCILGLVLSVPYATAVSGCLMGQTYRIAMEKKDAGKSSTKKMGGTV